MNNSKFLPVGTIVSLKGQDEILMINDYCIRDNTDSNNCYDYSGCPYPTGMIDLDKIITFNQADIESVVYYGYFSKEFNELNKSLINFYNSKPNLNINSDDDLEII